MSNIRSSTLYVTHQLGRWLQWLAEMENASSQESAKVTPDILAERILREHILAKHPDISKVEAAYWEARGRLDGMAVEELRKQKSQS